MAQPDGGRVDALFAELGVLKARLGEVETELRSLAGANKTRPGASADADADAGAPPGRPPAPTPLPRSGDGAPSLGPAPLPCPAEVPANSTRIVSCHIVMPADCDAQGVCVGGHVLSWIDICAGLSAKTLARGPCVTVSVDAVHFLRPCTLGCVVLVAARVNRTFASSMEVGVRVEAEDPRTGERAHCCSAYLTFVSMRARDRGGGGGGLVGGGGGTGSGGAGPAARTSGGGGGGGNTTHASRGSADGVPALAPRPPAPPAPLPTVVPTTGETRREWAQAAARRAARLAGRRRAGADPAQAAARAECRLRPVTHREGFPTLPPVLTAPCSLAAHFGAFGGGTEEEGATTGTGGGGGAGGGGAGDSGGGAGDGGGEDDDDGGGDDDDDAQQLVRPSSSPLNSGGGGAEPVDVLAQQLRGSAIAAAAGAEAEQARLLLLRRQRARPPPPPPPPRSPLAQAAARVRVSPASTTAYATHSILPQYANTLGVTFGGQVLAWIEQCAYVSAARLRGARRPPETLNPPGDEEYDDDGSGGASGGGGAHGSAPRCPPALPPALRFLTAGMDSVAFAAPTVVGDVMYLTAQCSAAFGSSLEVAVSVFAESPREGRVFHCADAFVTVVVVDGRGRPVPIPFELAPGTAAERMRGEGAAARREARLALRRALSERSRASLEMPLPQPSAGD